MTLPDLVASLGVSSAQFTADLRSVFEQIDALMDEKDAEIARLRTYLTEALDRWFEVSTAIESPADLAHIANMRGLLVKP